MKQIYPKLLYTEAAASCKMLIRFAAVIILSVMLVSAGRAQPNPVTVTISPQKDNTIYQRDASNSNGAGAYFVAGTTGSSYINRALIRFDIAGNIPAGAVITSASLTLHLAGASSNSGPSDIELHKLLQDWGEGSSDAGTRARRGAPATTDDATWINTFYPSAQWTTQGGDFNDTISSVQTIDQAGFYTWSSTGMVADIQRWLTDPGANYGWLLKSNETTSSQAKKFSSRQDTIIENRPVLTVTYTYNHVPGVSITSPAPDSSFKAGATITVKAAAADSDGTITKVEFFLVNDGAIKLGEDLSSPYELTAHEVEPGTYRVLVKATDNEGATGNSDTLTVTVTGCEGSGTIFGKGFIETPGSTVASFTSLPRYPYNPDITESLTSFEYRFVGVDYGARVEGYICAPLTGNYTFYISSDDQSELWLSPDEDPAHLRKIAFLNSPVPFRTWFAYSTQHSAPIRLIKGARYYIGSLHKQSDGDDHLSVGWQLPNGVFEAPIPGSRLSEPSQDLLFPPDPGEGGGGQGFEEAMRRANAFSIRATPNPSVNYFTLVTRSKSSGSFSMIITDILGRVVERRSGIPANGTIQFGGNFGKGMYFVEMIQGSNKKRIKLVKQ